MNEHLEGGPENHLKPSPPRLKYWRTWSFISDHDSYVKVSGEENGGRLQYSVLHTFA